MAKYLSPEWFTEMNAAASQWVSPADQGDKQVRIGECITDSPYGDVNYVMSIGRKLSVEQVASESAGDPQMADANVTFTQSYDVATQLHRDELTTHQALFDGKLRISGNLNALLENDELVRGVAPLFDQVRANTTY